MGSVGQRRWWRRLLATSLLVVGLVAMHAGVSALCCGTARQQASSDSVAMTTGMGASPDSPMPNACDHATGEVCQAVLGGSADHDALLLHLIAVAVAVGIRYGSGAVRAPVAPWWRRSCTGPPGPSLSSLCVLRV
jgi:hypothetical protein